MGKKDDAPAGAPLWMVTYSDMVTLLMTFFVMLLAMANFDDMEKVAAVTGSIRTALGTQADPPMKVGNGEKTATSDSENDGERDVDQMRSEMSVSLAEHLSDDRIKMTQDLTEVRIKLGDRVLFAPGSAELHPAAYRLIADLARGLKGKKVDVFIEGHSDSTGSVEDNWAMSSERALAVLIALQERGDLDGRFMQARAMGQYHPADTKTGSVDWNRRVEIVIRARDNSAHEAYLDIEGGR